jgi:hypothetical protein
LSFQTLDFRMTGVKPRRIENWMIADDCECNVDVSANLGFVHYISLHKFVFCVELLFLVFSCSFTIFLPFNRPSVRWSWGLESYEIWS